MIKKERGLTLIALIVTIIVMIILAGITISVISGNSGIIDQAQLSKNKSGRQEIIEKARVEISDLVVENVGTDVTKNQLKEILDKYFENVPDDYTLNTELTTKSEYGNYKIKVSEIYNQTELLADNSTNSVNTSNTNDNNSGSTNNSSMSTTTSNSSNNTQREPEEINVTGVQLDSKSVILDLNGENTIQLNATPIPSNANKNTTMKWTSKKKTIATVTQAGLVTGKKVGNSTIMAATSNGKSAECLVVCQAKITGITMNPVKAFIPLGETTQLTATITPGNVTEKITWKSSNTDVAKVNGSGLVTGIGNGKVIITAQNPAGTIKATCEVNVGNATLMAATSGTESDTDTYLRSNIAKNKIESVRFVKGQVPTSGVIEQFDASEAGDNRIIGYYTDEDGNGMYELTISSGTNIEANQNSSYLFYYLSSVKEIAFENFIVGSQVTDMCNMFDSCISLTNLDFSKFDTSQVTDMSKMFNGCEKLTDLDVSNFDTSKVKSMHRMFDSCKSLTSLDLSKFNTSKVTHMSRMFYHCGGLISLNVSKFDTSQVTNMAGMFDECSSLTILDVSKFDTSQVTDMDYMFYHCKNLKCLDLRKFSTNLVTEMNFMFWGCENLITIYVSEYNETNNKGWITKNITGSENMFYNSTNLVGGNGTKYNSNNIDATYARIDKEGQTGYLTKLTKPELAVLSQFPGEYESIDKGIVIYVMRDADGDGKIDEPDWTDKKKMQETYDQFVWVPVKNAVLDLSSTYSGLDDDGIKAKVQEQINLGKYPMAIKTNTAGDYTGVLYEFSEVTENNNTYVKVTPYPDWTPKSTSNPHYREPAGLTNSTFGDTSTNLSQINGILNTNYNSTTSFENALQSEYNEMVNKVSQNGGFWVGRYETSNMSDETTTSYSESNKIQVGSKRNTTNGTRSVTWFRIYAQEKIYSEKALGSEETQKSSMIWGSQYEQIMIWMKEEASSEQAQSRGKYYVTNGVGKGNFGTIEGIDDGNPDTSKPAPTGSRDEYSVKNVFDLAGNLHEWTLEALNDYERVCRGADYDNMDDYDTWTAYRVDGNPTHGGSSVGSRLTLY